MGDPDLYSDESIRLTAENIIVKSAPFEAILTNKRIILVDSRKKHIPQQTILLATLRHVEMGENAIRDPVITLSVITNTGSTRQMILTFSKKAGGERKRECDEWGKILKEYSASSSQTVTHMVAPSPDHEKEPEVTTPPQIRMTSSSAVKKKIEISRPIKKIVETGPVPIIPIETSSLPEGSFCFRCGSRVPVGSAFCNRCGSKVLLPGEQGAVPEPVAAVVPAPVVQTVPAPPVVPVIPPLAGSTPPLADSTLPGISSTSPVTPELHARAVRPIEQIIHSIEPLIEDSVPRTEPAPLIVREHPIHPATPVVAEMPAAITEPPVDASPPSAPAGEGVPAPSVPVIPTGDTPPAEPPVTPPVPASGPASKKRMGITIAAIIIAILVIAGGAFIVLKPMLGTGSNTGGSIAVTPTVTPPITPAVTPPITPAVTPSAGTITTAATIPPTPSPTPTTEVTTPIPVQVAIPQTGVWIRITYPGTYTGTYGLPGQQAQVTDTGDHFYQIATVEGPVAASIKKQDGSANNLEVAVYKDGNLIKKESTIRPMGTIDFHAVFKTPTPTPVPTTITPIIMTTVNPVINATGNATVKGT